MTTQLKFELPPFELIFQDGAQYPAARPIELLQVSDRTAGGTLETEDLGVTLKTRVLAFDGMSKTDYDGLVDWFLNIAKGGMNSFSFTDERGTVGDVVILDKTLSLRETSYQRFSGSITLEYIQ